MGLRVALGQMEVVPGRPDINTATMLKMIDAARQQQAELVIFPELAVPGYLLGNAWEQIAFLKDCERYGRQIVGASGELAVIFGNVYVDWEQKGHDGRVRKYNALFVAYRGKLLGGDNFPYPCRIKTLQHDYREFDDSRHFYSLQQLALEQGQRVEALQQPVLLKMAEQTIRLACLPGEDSWSDAYDFKAATAIKENGPVDLFVNIASSPFALGKNRKHNRVFARQAREQGTPIIYVNNVGVQNNGKTVYIFDGCSTVYNARGEISAYCQPFAEKLTVVELEPDGNVKDGGAPVVPEDGDIAAIYQALTYGIDRFMQAIGMKKVVIGLSGGIDSAVAACLYTNVLGPENVLLVNMPSKFNSQTTKNLAARLAANLGCLYTVMPIQEAVDYTVEQIGQTPIIDMKDGREMYLPVTPFMTENIQARDRSARILAALAAAFGGGFTCNANKSEMTVGYTTLYGDQAGFLAALADLWKYQVYGLADYLNEQVYRREVIPREIIKLVPSAELSPAQAVEAGKGDPLLYPYHDYLFRAFVERWERATPEDILAWYAQGVLEEKIGCQSGVVQQLFASTADFIADLERWWRQYTGIAVAKRIQAPPVLAVSRRAYGFDCREAQNGTYFTAGYLALKKQLLQAEAGAKGK